MGNPLAAIICSLIAYTMLNIGFVLQKKGAVSLPPVELQSLVDNIKNFLKNKVWLFGFGLTIIQYFFYLLALGFGESITLVTPFNGWGMVVLVVFSYFYLKESISRAELVCIGVTVAGVVVLGTTSPGGKIDLMPGLVESLLSTPVSIAFLLILGGLTIIPVVLSWKRSFWHADIILGVCSGFAASISAIFSNALMAHINGLDVWPSIWTALSNLVFWFYLFMVGAGNLISVVYQQIAYQKGKASLVAPLFTIVTLVLPIIAGIIIFGEWNLVEPGLAGLRAASIIVITAGAAMLSYFNSKHGKQTDSRTPKLVTRPDNAPPPPEIGKKAEIP